MPEWDFATVERIFGAATYERHSPLYVALRDNHDAIAKALDSGRPDWRKIVAGLAGLGIVDGKGAAPTIRGAQQTWYRVRRDVAALTAGRV